MGIPSILLVINDLHKASRITLCWHPTRLVIPKKPRFLAALRGQKDAVQLLVEAKCDKSRADNDGHTPLHAACGRGHVEALVLNQPTKGFSFLGFFKFVEAIRLINLSPMFVASVF